MERLRAKATDRNSSAEVAAEMAMYVPPLSSPSKDTPRGDPSVDHLETSVPQWLNTCTSKVLLLHGQSGSGKSLYVFEAACLCPGPLVCHKWTVTVVVALCLLSVSYDRACCRYCVRLEQQLWAKYHRGDSSFVPLLISLPAAKDAAKSAVAERLHEVGLTSIDLFAKRWIFILDGYDEVQGSSNFIVGNGLDRAHKVKVIVSCRTEYLEGKGAYRGLFTPTGSRSTQEALEELYVQPFQTSQVSMYFHHWVRRHDAADGGSSKKWTAQDYVDFIWGTPGLADLAQTPFVLRAMADALPRLGTPGGPGHSGPSSGQGGEGGEGGNVSAGRRRTITRAKVYEAFIAECWEVATRRLRRSEWPQGLPPDYDAPLSFENFSRDLAVDMLASGQVGASDWCTQLGYDAAGACCRASRCMAHPTLHQCAYRSRLQHDSRNQCQPHTHASDGLLCMGAWLSLVRWPWSPLQGCTPWEAWAQAPGPGSLPPTPSHALA